MGGNVLVVDDEAVVRQVIERILVKAGYQVKTCSSGLEAVIFLKTQLPDLVLMDMKMPMKNGIETLQDIRKMNIQVPIIMVTAVDDAGDGARAMEAGAVDYVTKPIDWNRLLEMVSFFTYLHPRRQSDPIGG